jgi:hypothetical protein
MVAMPTHYTITYNQQRTHGSCANDNTVTMALVNHGIVKHQDTYVDLLTIYHTPNESGAYPTQFTLRITYTSGFDVETIHKFETGNTASISAVDDESGEWTLTVSGPTQTETTNFQLDYDGSSPPEKLRIRVKRQPAFGCGTGPFDDQI